MLPLRQLFYISRVRPGLRDADVAEILAESRRRNHSRDITGALTMTPRHFGQFIEGRPTDLDPLLAALRRDPRHVDLKVLMDRVSKTRAFPNWSMGFIYKLALAEELERLFEAADPPGADDIALILRLGPDSLMGALTG